MRTGEQKIAQRCIFFSPSLPFLFPSLPFPSPRACTCVHMRFSDASFFHAKRRIFFYISLFLFLFLFLIPKTSTQRILDECSSNWLQPNKIKGFRVALPCALAGWWSVAKNSEMTQKSTVSSMKRGLSEWVEMRLEGSTNIRRLFDEF